MFCSIKRYRVLIIRTLQSIQIDPDRSGSRGIGTESEMAAAATVDKALDLLFRLHEESSPMGVTALGLALGVPKSSAHRLLASLCRRGLVEQDDRGRYRPGIGLVALGLGALEREPLVAAARPVLEAEALALGETVFLVVARAGRLVVLDKAEGTGFLRAAPRVGSEVPLHATAVGKLFLALDPAAVKRPPGDPERFTEHTLRGLALDRAVALAREGAGRGAGRGARRPRRRRACATDDRHGSRRGRPPRGGRRGARLRASRRSGVVSVDGHRPLCWIDGRVVPSDEARIPVVDHGLLYGDGIFEGIRVFGSRVFRLDRHLARFAAGARALGLSIPGGIPAVREIVLETARAYASWRRGERASSVWIRPRAATPDCSA
jgi:DNA-binding IclR family transcriptional regulator